MFVFRRIVFGCLFFLIIPGSQILASPLDKAYQAAVVDAALIEKEEISNTLLSVNPENDQLVWNDDGSKILVVTWKSNGAYESFLEPYTATSENEAYAVWVTLAPQVQEFCNEYMSKNSNTKKDLDLRLKQYLGLNHDWTYEVFVELWVSPESIFRPCVDPETSDTACNLNFGETIPAVENVNDYQQFYKDLYYKSFRSSAGVPWTGLGYTYDWGNKKSSIGASEFILTPGAAYEIHQVTPTIEYCS